MSAAWLGACAPGGAPWCTGTGPEEDVVISSRLRLARNVEGFAFVNRASPEARGKLLTLARGVLGSLPLGAGGAWLELHTLAGLDRTLLVERHLISKEHAKGDEPRGVLVSLPDERVSVMVNEEDHLRIQVVRPGLALGEAHTQIDAVDDQIESRLDYAYSPRLGYLTACPTNVGTAIRCSAMLHLPGLKLAGEIDKAKRAARDMGLAVRGFYGEGSEALGDFYQVSNQVTLGKSEEHYVQEMERDILPQLIAYERQARTTMLEKRRRTLEDQVWRALGTLRNARMIAPDEALTHLSMARLGVLLGIIPGVHASTIAKLVVVTQPAHLQKCLGRELDQQERREARADLLRQSLA